MILSRSRVRRRRRARRRAAGSGSGWGRLPRRAPPGGSAGEVATTADRSDQDCWREPGERSFGTSSATNAHQGAGQVSSVTRRRPQPTSRATPDEQARADGQQDDGEERRPARRGEEGDLLGLVEDLDSSALASDVGADEPEEGRAGRTELAQPRRGSPEKPGGGGGGGGARRTGLSRAADRPGRGSGQVPFTGSA